MTVTCSSIEDNSVVKNIFINISYKLVPIIHVYFVYKIIKSVILYQKNQTMRMFTQDMIFIIINLFIANYAIRLA